MSRQIVVHPVLWEAPLPKRRRWPWLVFLGTAHETSEHTGFSWAAGRNTAFLVSLATTDGMQPGDQLTVHLPVGRISLNGPIHLGSGITLQGAGRGTRLRLVESPLEAS